jgi:hypothetical protein
MAELTSRIRRSVEAYQQLWFAPADPRVYALARIAFATSVLLTLLDFWPIRLEYFAAGGSLDRAAIAAANGWRFPSVLYWIDSATGVTLFFCGGALAAICLATGIATRTAALAVFVLVLSYTNRARAVTTGADQLLRVFSLLFAVSPIHRAFALDERWRVGRRQARTTEVPSYGLVLMRLQVFIIYYQTAWMKSGDKYWRAGDLMSYFLMSMYSRFPARQWADWETLANLMTYGSLLIELSVPWLLLFRRTRPLGFLLGFSMHIAIAILSDLALFSICMMSTYLVFLDRADVDALIAWARRLRWPRALQGPASAHTAGAEKTARSAS